MKTLAEIAIEAGLVTKAGAAKAGRLADEHKLPLIAVLIKELGIDEVALIGALRKQTRVPLIDPADIQIDIEALRLISRDACARLRVLPLAVAIDGIHKVLRIAMADPTDTSAILELEELTQCDIEVNALPLSAIDELVDQGYRQLTTAIVARPRGLTRPTLQAEPSLDTRFTALCQLLVAKGLITEAEIDEVLRKLSES